jgi:hypothetical protein
MSCRSPEPSVKTETEVKGTENTNEWKSANDSLNMQIYRNSVFLKDWASNFTFNFNRKDINWSAPDSAGKQYPTSTSETIGNATGQSQGKEQSESKESIQIQMFSQKVDSLSRKVDYLVKQSQVVAPDPVTVEKKLSWWQTLFIWTGGITWIIIIIGLIVWTNKRTSWISGLLKLIKS